MDIKKLSKKLIFGGLVGACLLCNSCDVIRRNDRVECEYIPGSSQYTPKTAGTWSKYSFKVKTPYGNKIIEVNRSLSCEIESVKTLVESSDNQKIIILMDKEEQEQNIVSIYSNEIGLKN